MKAADAYLTGVPPLPERLEFTGIRRDVNEQVETAALPDDCPETEDGFARLAVAEFDGIAPHPIAPEASLADRELSAEVARHNEQVTRATQRVEQARRICEAKSDALIETPPATSFMRLLVLCLPYLALAALVSAAVGLLLATTLDDAFLHNYLADKVDDPDGVSMFAAIAVATSFVFAQCALQLLYVLAIRGDLGWWRRLGLLTLDVAFAAAWGVQRCQGGVSLMAISITLIEFVAAAFYTVAVSGLAERLKRNAVRVEPYQDALHAASAAAASLKNAERRLARATEELSALIGPISMREAAVRAAPFRRTAAEETARMQYRVSVSALAAQSAKNPSLDALDEDLDRHSAMFQLRADRATRSSS